MKNLAFDFPKNTVSNLKNSEPEHERSFRGKLQSCFLETAQSITKIKAFNEGKAYLSDQTLA